MRLPLIAGNWKMNTSVMQAKSLVEAILAELNGFERVEKVVCPPFVSLATVHMLIKDSSLKLGAQNMYFEEKGAYTGEISPLMLKDLCQYVILGHSERRHYFGESDAVINSKVRAAYRYGLIPILCVGEKLEEKETGKTETVVSRQIRAALADITPSGLLVIAYEPVWAIGTGRSATPEQAEDTISYIRNLIATLWDRQISEKVRLLYGGSVTPDNISELAGRPEIDGALVGGASLKAGDFTNIIRKTGQAKKV